MKQFLFICLLLLLSGCATAFIGKPHLTRDECAKKCDSWGMVMSGMVAMGEYSDGCVCSVKTSHASKNDSSLELTSAAVAPAAVGVMMQMQIASQQANSHPH